MAGTRAFGYRRQAENITDQDLLREVMNTADKEGRLGDSIRCVVSVSMLTEGWDASTVMHVLGVPFDFTAKPVVAPPQPPRQTIQVKAVRPDRDKLEIQFSRVQGYLVELSEERLPSEFTDDSILELTPDIVGPSITKNQGIIGDGVDLNLEHLEDMRRSTLLFHVARRLLYTKWRDSGEDPKLHLFGQLKRIARQWGVSSGGCQGKEIHHGELLGAWVQQPWAVRPMGFCRIYGRLPDSGRFYRQSRSGIQQDD